MHGAWEGTWVIVLRYVYFLLYYTLCMKERRQLGGVLVVGMGNG
jgi:hypothetical protein